MSDCVTGDCEELLFIFHLLRNGDEVAQHAIEVHEVPKNLERAGEDAFHGEKKRDEVQPLLNGGDVLPRCAKMERKIHVDLAFG